MGKLQEHKTIERKFKSSKDFAESLGFSFNPETSESWYRTYEKPIKIDGIPGYLSISLQDLRVSHREERIKMTVSLEKGITPWKLEISAPEIDSDLNKDQLKKSGYSRLAVVISRIEKEETKDLLQILQAERSKGIRFIEQTLIPQAREALSRFKISHVENLFKKTKMVFVYGEPEKGKVTVTVVCFLVRSNNLDIAVGRSKVDDGKVDNVYFQNRGNPYYIIPPTAELPPDPNRTEPELFRLIGKLSWSSWNWEELPEALEEVKKYFALPAL